MSCEKINIFYLLLTTVLLSILSYMFVDKELAFALSPIRKQHFWFSLFHWMQYVDVLEYILPVILIYLAIILLLGKYNVKINKFLFSFSISFYVTGAVTKILKIIFGRYWTETFLNDNLSLIRDGVYGFTFFNMHREYQSFPSSHSAALFAVMTIVWIYYPKLRILSVAMCIIVVIGLLGCNYHFLSDIIAGACIGFASGILVNSYVSNKTNIPESSSY